MMNQRDNHILDAARTLHEINMIVKSNMDTTRADCADIITKLDTLNFVLRNSPDDAVKYIGAPLKNVADQIQKRDLAFFKQPAFKARIASYAEAIVNGMAGVPANLKRGVRDSVDVVFSSIFSTLDRMSADSQARVWTLLGILVNHVRRVTS
jgi:hypothetical protein